MKSQEKKKSSLSKKRKHHSQIEKKPDVIYIPFDITEEILSKLPVKSLVRFQCVSKQWSSLITNSIMTWSLAKPRLLVILDRRLSISSVISLSSYPLTTNKESVPAEQDGHALVRVLNCNVMYQAIRGLIFCLTSSSQFLIYNNTTRESLLLPKIHSDIPASFMDGFFGYDPVENQYKVFCMIRGSQTTEDSYQVFTLGDPKKQWRNIQGFGTFLSPTMTTRVCIKGRIYCRASIKRYGNIPKPNPQDILLTFDVRSERFDYKELPDQSTSLTLVNYKGRLGCICYSDHSAEMWVCEDHAERQEWCKIVLFMSSSLINSLGHSTRVAGVTFNGEIVIMPKRLDCADTLYAEYYDPKQKKSRRVELKNNLRGELKEVRVFSVPDHVENPMSLLDLTYMH